MFPSLVAAHAGGRLGRCRYRQRRPVGDPAGGGQGLPAAGAGQWLRRRLDGAGPAVDQQLQGSGRQEGGGAERLDRAGIAELEAQAGGRVRQGRDGLHGQPGPADPADARRRGGDLLLRALCARSPSRTAGASGCGCRTIRRWARPTSASSRREKFTKAEPELTSKMVQAHVKATQEMASDSSIAIETTIQQFKMTREVAELSIKNLFFSAESGAPFVGGLKALAKMMVERQDAGEGARLGELPQSRLRLRWTGRAAARHNRRRARFRLIETLGETMPYATADDGVKLYYEEVGGGTPIVFVHEFAADHRSMGGADALLRPAPPLHHLRRARLSALGRPEKPTSYSQDRATDDILAVMKHLEARQGAHRRPVDGRLRVPAFRPAPCRARAVAGRGGRGLRRGEGPAGQSSGRGRGRGEVAAQRGHGRVRREVMPTGRRACSSRTRTRAASPSSKELGEHSALGSANTQIGCQGRPSLYDLVDGMRR